MMTGPFDRTGRVAVVTSANSGIGAGHGEACGRRGEDRRRRARCPQEPGRRGERQTGAAPASAGSTGIVASTVLLISTCRFAGVGLNEVNGLEILSRTDSAPILARSDNA
jgi:NAD(P)-dependent dehydrogenase (short-subunit alcohol dehydrogenase family)